MKVNGLKKNSFEVVLFVKHINNGFNLCKVKSNIIEPKNLISLFLNFIRAFFFNFRIVSDFYKLEKKTYTSNKLILKRIILNLHIINEKKNRLVAFWFCFSCSW